MSPTTNRPDAGHGESYNGHITTSFADNILVPLPCWIFLVGLVIILLTTRRDSRPNSNAQGHDDAETKNSTAETNVHRRKGFSGHCGRRFLTYLMCLFTFGVLFLTIDEMIRLSHLNWGIGLLPFVPATAFLATTLFFARNKLQSWYHRGGKRGGSIRNKIIVLIMVFWILEIAVEGVKISGLKSLEDTFPRKDTSYPIPQQVMDIIIAMGCMALLFLLMLTDIIRAKIHS